MALNLVEKKKQQQILILVLVVVMLITATVLWFGYFKQAPIVVVSEESPQGVALPMPQQVEINFGVLSLPPLEELNAPEEPIEEPQVKGRSNPFLPF